MKHKSSRNNEIAMDFCSGYFVIIGVDSVLLFRSHRRGLSLFTGMEVTIFSQELAIPPTG